MSTDQQPSLPSCDGCGQSDGRCLPHCKLRDSEMQESGGITARPSDVIERLRRERDTLRRRLAGEQKANAELRKRIKAHTGRCDFCFDRERACPDCGPILTGMPDEAWKAEQ